LRNIALAGLAAVLISIGLVLPLRWVDPPTTAFILQDASGRVPVLQEWTPWEQLGEAAALAAVAAEDQRFAEHFGIDIHSIRKSIATAVDGGRLRGASTISQQVAKNLYLWPGRDFVRKGIEAWLTIVIELCLPKQRIIEIYLNIAEFGPGIYGVPAASRYFLQKDALRLSDAEAALLAAVLPNPRQLRVDKPSAYVRERQAWIQRQVQRLRREQWLTRLQ
jgi:monofunctional biosynthetic peptidoglycan transglycosylase